MAKNILPGIEVRQGGIYCALSIKASVDIMVQLQ